MSSQAMLTAAMMMASTAIFAATSRSSRLSISTKLENSAAIAA